ncbi:MAG TPA: alpha/beta hydrolase [Tepidisphaeraceae bacterium]
MHKKRRPDVELPLWREGVPGQIAGVTDVPRMAVYKAARANAPCMLICPGGGYATRASHEADPVALWLNTLGITGVVVHYRVKPYRHPHPLNDLSQAMRLTQRHAAEWSIDANRIGVLGFSAGGHLASTLCTIADEDVRPALAVLLYPVITLGDVSAHTGSRANLVPHDDKIDWIERLSTDRQVTPKTPPTFLSHTAEDAVVPIENALLYVAAMRRHGVPFEAHFYERGRHGVGLAQDDASLSTWPGLCANWLRLRGWVA